MLSQIDFNYLLEYRDGELYWRVTVSKYILAGDKLKCYGKLNRKKIIILGKHYLKAKIIWIMHNGPIAQGCKVKHKEFYTDKCDNSIENLILVNKEVINRC